MRWSDLSLRTRLLCGIGAMLLPLLALAIGGFYAERQVTAALKGVVGETLDEMNPIMHLEREILLQSLFTHDALVHHDPGAIRAFEAQGRQVERVIAVVLAAPFDDGTEIQLIWDAVAEWRKAQAIAPRLLALAQPSSSPQTQVYMDQFMGHVTAATRLLGQADELSHAEINQARIDADKVHAYMARLVAAVLIMGLLIYLVIARALNRSQATLAELAIHDGLTGLYDRREFNRRLRAEIERAQRYRRPLTLLMLDIDHFKDINDHYGHLVGDEVLCKVAGCLSGTVRPADQVARYGGEEFAVLLPETDSEQALLLAQRLCENCRSHRMSGRQGQQIGLTVSIGVAAYPRHARNSDALIAAADRALYAAKAAGRDRVVLQSEAAAAVTEEEVAPP